MTRDAYKFGLTQHQKAGSDDLEAVGFGGRWADGATFTPLTWQCKARKCAQRQVLMLNPWLQATRMRILVIYVSVRVVSSARFNGALLRTSVIRFAPTPPQFVLASTRVIVAQKSIDRLNAYISSELADPPTAPRS